jgi:hypothetical protein
MSRHHPAQVKLRIKELKFVDPPFSGWERSYWKCKRHGRVSYRDYLPFSLSNPIIGGLSCGCSGDPRDGQVEKVHEHEALPILLEQYLSPIKPTRKLDS